MNENPPQRVTSTNSKSNTSKANTTDHPTKSTASNQMQFFHNQILGEWVEETKRTYSLGSNKIKDSMNVPAITENFKEKIRITGDKSAFEK